jgi:hypothetical protein
MKPVIASFNRDWEIVIKDKILRYNEYIDPPQESKIEKEYDVLFKRFGPDYLRNLCTEEEYKEYLIFRKNELEEDYHGKITVYHVECDQQSNTLHRYNYMSDGDIYHYEKIYFYHIYFKVPQIFTPKIGPFVIAYIDFTYLLSYLKKHAFVHYCLPYFTPGTETFLLLGEIGAYSTYCEDTNQQVTRYCNPNGNYFVLPFTVLGENIQLFSQTDYTQFIQFKEKFLKGLTEEKECVHVEITNDNEITVDDFLTMYTK